MLYYWRQRRNVSGSRQSLSGTMTKYIHQQPFFQWLRRDNDEMAPSSCYTNCDDYQQELLLMKKDETKMQFTNYVKLQLRYLWAARTVDLCRLRAFNYERPGATHGCTKKKQAPWRQQGSGEENEATYGPILIFMRLRKKPNALFYQKGSSVVIK